MNGLLTDERTEGGGGWRVEGGGTEKKKQAGIFDF